jgi:hypothetical protein
MKIIGSHFIKFGLFALLGLSSQIQAQAQWNAYNDFYLSPTAAGWGGATSPSSALGTAWGYYAANVNGFGFPTQIGSYMTPTASGSGSQNMYQYSNVAPIGAGTYVGASGWAAAGGAGFGYYADTHSWGSSLGRYDTPWFGGAPGLSQGLSNLIWMQSGWLGSGASEGIAPVLTWTAASSGQYSFSGLFVSGDQAANSSAVAIVTSSGVVVNSGQLLSRTVLSNNSVENFSFLATFAAGDTVQFQVGNNFSAGNAVGLQVTATSIPEPSSGLLLTAGLGVLGLVRRLRRQA